MTTSLRCHLLIGPLASGKTTVAGRLVEQLTARGVQAMGLPITNDWCAVRQHCAWPVSVFLSFESLDEDVPRHMFSRVARGFEVVVDGTPVTRDLRHRYLQSMPMPRAVHWIGWCMHTPLATCREWNRHRLNRWNAELLEAIQALSEEHPSLPSLAEGFHGLVHLDPSIFAESPGHADLDALINQALDDLDHGRGDRTLRPWEWTGQDPYWVQLAGEHRNGL